jgi:DNA-binding transcriptional LysR family regulator
MHLETLKTFRDLVETGSFTKAAALNFISQSAVSQQLKALETRYHCQLIERGTRRGVTPTESGRLLYAECSELLERLRALETRLHERATVIAGTVRVATVYSVGLHQLPPFVTRFMKAHPRVKVHVEYRRTDKVCEGCLNDTLDIGIVALPLGRRTKVSVIPWQEETLVLVCPPEHRLARRRRASPTQLRGEPFIAFERDIPTRKTVDRILAAHKVRVNTVMEFDNIETIKRSVEVGSGISILPETRVVNEVKAGLLARIDLGPGGFTRSVGIIHRRGRTLSAAAQEFVRVLLTSA